MSQLGKTKMKSLTVLQNRCVRVLTSSNNREHAEPLYKSLNILKLTDLKKLEMTNLAELNIRREGPRVFWDKLRLKTVSHPRAVKRGNAKFLMEPTIKGNLIKLISTNWNSQHSKIDDAKSNKIKEILKKSQIELYKL